MKTKSLFISFLIIVCIGYHGYSQNTFPSSGDVVIQGSESDLYIINTSESESGIIFSDAQDISGYQVAKIMYNSNTTADNTLNFYMGNDQVNPRMTIDYSGNVGIGCSDPQVKLAVNGTIKASELTITTAPCSDFVFEPGYSLMDLNSLEEYVMNRKHLPEVPSAQEFAEKGYSVGEMDDLLLRKIEELTLYIIKQQKEFIKQQKEIEELKSKLK